MDAKIKDLTYRINGLVPKDVCTYLINFFEDNIEDSRPEGSYKYIEDKALIDNFKSLNLNFNVEFNKDREKFIKPLKLAQQYIGITITNYVLHIQRSICPTFREFNICNSNNVRILRYQEGQYIGDHTDVDFSYRASCTLNLNEGYEGGDFRIFNGRLKENFKRGDAFIFPAEPIWIHGTEPITKGTRYCINAFLYPKTIPNPSK